MDNATKFISGSMCFGDIKFIYIPKVNNATKPSQGESPIFCSFCFVLKINTEKRKYGRAYLLTPVIPALWETKAGGSRGQEFETSLANTVKPHLF